MTLLFTQKYWATAKALHIAFSSKYFSVYLFCLPYSKERKQASFELIWKFIYLECLDFGPAKSLSNWRWGNRFYGSPESNFPRFHLNLSTQFRLTNRWVFHGISNFLVQNFCWDWDYFPHLDNSKNWDWKCHRHLHIRFILKSSYWNFPAICPIFV